MILKEKSETGRKFSPSRLVNDTKILNVEEIQEEDVFIELSLDSSMTPKF